MLQAKMCSRILGKDWSAEKNFVKTANFLVKTLVKILDYHIPQNMNHNQNFNISIFEIQNCENRPEYKRLNQHKHSSIRIMCSRKNNR